MQRRRKPVFFPKESRSAEGKRLKGARSPVACNGLCFENAATSLIPGKGKRMGEPARRRDKFSQRRAGTDHDSRSHSLRRRRNEWTRRAAHAGADVPVASTLLLPGCSMSGLSGTCRKKQIHPSDGPPPPKHTHLWSLRPPLLHDAGFAGRPFVYQKPRVRRAGYWRAPSSRTPSKLNIDQHLLQRVAATGRANSSQRLGAKPHARPTSLGAALTSKDVEE